MDTRSRDDCGSESVTLLSAAPEGAAELRARDVVDEAIGILVQRNQCSPQEALGILRAAARQGGVELRTAATNLVDAAQETEWEADEDAAPATDVGADEAGRLCAVARYDILDTPPDAAFDRIAALAARWLHAPIATVSIVDSDRIWFKATHGLEGVRQVGRDPGLCASAIQQDGTYVVTDALADPAAVENPLVRGELGIRFYAAAPITTADGYRLGTVNVLDFRQRQASDDELATLRDLASLVTDQLELRLSALNTVRREREQRAQLARDNATMEWFATTLERTLLPATLPDVPGLQLAAHHQPADPRQVSGDFYDVFALDDDRWVFLLGDVEGHGAPAAVVTALARYTVRTAAMHDPDPLAVLEELNAALLRDPDVSQCCTILVGTLCPDPAGGFEITLAGGGHPPALWLRSPAPGAHPVVDPVWPAGGMLVGALSDASFATCRLRLEPGHTLLLHTDGLIEARPGGRFFGEQRLTTFLGERTRHTPDDLITDLADLIAGFDPQPDDDVALLALGVPLR